MGESGQVVLTPGVGAVNPLFTQRAHRFSKEDEVSTPYLYQVVMDATAIEADYNLTESIFSPVPGGAQPVPAIVSEGANGRTRRAVPVKAEATRLPVPRTQRRRNAGTIRVDMTATGHVGYMQVHFADIGDTTNFVVQATRQNWTGTVVIDATNREISGSNTQRQDYCLGPFHASGFRGYFVSRFSEPFASYGVAYGKDIKQGAASGEGEHLSGYVTFGKGVRKIEVRTGVSFVSVDQARRNLDTEAPDSITFSDAVENLKKAWLEKLGRVTITGYNKTDTNHDPRTIFYSALFHALQYPSVRITMSRGPTQTIAIWICVNADRLSLTGADLIFLRLLLCLSNPLTVFYCRISQSLSIRPQTRSTQDILTACM
jgi:putative alpha-1,2-mannosidase